MAWPTTPVAVGDLITAAQLNRLPIAIAEASGAGSSYDFQSIPAYWNHLLIVTALETNSNNGQDLLQIQFNNDTSSGKYTRQYLKASNATVTASASSSQNSAICGECSGKSGGAFSALGILIPNYAVAQAHCVIAFAMTSFALTPDSSHETMLAGGAWIPASAAAINRVTLTPAAGSFVSGSEAMLYGLGDI